ncbi:MAG: pentapeptide repeat-containing protein [Cyanobacteria bacterium P01_D01_bin.1]
MGRKVIAACIVGITVVFSLYLAVEPPEGFSLPYSYYLLTKGIVGLTTSSLVVFLGLTTTDSSTKGLEKQGAENLKFLKSWAIALSAHGGTSFYNLNLSQVNFSSANLANSDFRAASLYRTILNDVTGLDLARVDSRYLDLENPKVQRLLTKADQRNQDFQKTTLKGAYLQSRDLREFDFTDADLAGADLSQTDLRGSRLTRTQAMGTAFDSADLRKSSLLDANLTESSLREADLRECLFVRTQVARADFTGADLTGICIEDWSVSSKTCFTDVRCDYIYRQYIDGVACDRYPVGRDFGPGEFATLFTEPEDIIELVFKGEFDYAALSLSLYKLQTEAPDLDLELKGIEQRGKLWVVKVKSENQAINERLVEERLSSVYQAPSTKGVTETIQDSIYQDYEETKSRLAESQRLVRQLAGLSGDQAEALKELTKKSLGNNFFISGSTITNLAGSGQIDYREAADRVRNLVTNPSDPSSTWQRLLSLLNTQNVATTSETQQELIQQILLSEADKDPQFRQFLHQQGEQIIGSLPDNELAAAIRTVISQI